MKKKRFELRCPAIWSDIESFTESTYDEEIQIVKGVGYCDSYDSAERMKKFGYIVKDLSEENEKDIKVASKNIKPFNRKLNRR